MVNSQIKDQHQYITRLICQMRLTEAILVLKEFLVEAHDWNLESKLEQTETAYNYMLEYMRNNAADPGRKELHYKLLTDILFIADQAMLKRLSSSQNPISYFKVQQELSNSDVQYTLPSIIMELEAYTENYAVANLLKDGSGEEQLKSVRKRHEEMQDILFKTVWTKPLWSAEDEEDAKKIMESVLIQLNDLCLFVSAVTLSLMECFDLRKLMFLFHLYEQENNHIKQRALVGLAITFQIYHARMPFYPEIKARLLLLDEDDKISNDLGRVQIQMLRSQETEKIDKKMREEIIPEMIKNANAHNMRINPDENDEENDDFNPDWSQDFENSPLADKLKEMSELQMEGADVYMSTFSQLKNYPFFRNINNWFYPFDKQHSMVAEELIDSKSDSILNLILESAFFCDSDKYSLCFTIMHIPKTHRDAMLGQLSEQQLNELTDTEKSASIKKFSERPENITNQYLHSLYRFFKLYPRRHEFLDIFKEPIRLNEYPILKDIMSRTDLLLNLADFYFRKEYFKEASEVYLTLLKKDGNNAEIYQKLGYCYQKQKDYDLAINAYLKADMIKPDNVWTNRHLATCYRVKKDYNKAVAFYKKVEEVQPENRSLLFNTGSCLAELERYEEALQYFFKLDFVDPENLRTWRAIAWCSYILQKLEQAMKYYNKILDTGGVAPDYMNAGHVAWSLGNMKQAIELYSKSCKLSGNKVLFLDIFNKDKEHLLKSGISEDDIALMYDLL